MKKILFLAIGAALSTTISAQQVNLTQSTVDLSNRVTMPNGSKKSTASVSDTITPAFSCGNVTFYADANNSIVTGTYAFSNGDVVESVGQALNLDGNTMDVYGLIGLTVYKEQGPNKGSFTAAIYDTTNGISTNPLGTSGSVSYDNVNDTNSTSFLTEFTFSNPVHVTAPFWGTIDVDNGSDTLSLASTSSGCGANGIFKTSQGWSYFSSIIGGPISVFILAEVGNVQNNVGMSSHFISKAGLDFYPNPAQDHATIEFNLPGENEVKLLIQNVAGQTVFAADYNVTENHQQIDLDLSKFKSGAYTYQVVGKKSQLNGVFLKK